MNNRKFMLTTCDIRLRLPGTLWEKCNQGELLYDQPTMSIQYTTHIGLHSGAMLTLIRKNILLRLVLHKFRGHYIWNLATFQVLFSSIHIISAKILIKNMKLNVLEGFS